MSSIVYKKGDPKDREAAKIIAGCRDKGKDYPDTVTILNAAGLKTPNGLAWTIGNLPSFVTSRKKMINRLVQSEDAKVPTRKPRSANKSVAPEAERVDISRKNTNSNSLKETILHILTDPNLSNEKRIKVLVTYLQ